MLPAVENLRGDGRVGDPAVDVFPETTSSLAQPGKFAAGLREGGVAGAGSIPVCATHQRIATSAYRAKQGALCPASPCPPLASKATSSGRRSHASGFAAPHRYLSSGEDDGERAAGEVSGRTRLEHGDGLRFEWLVEAELRATFRSRRRRVPEND